MMASRWELVQWQQQQQQPTLALDVKQPPHVFSRSPPRFPFLFGPIWRASPHCEMRRMLSLKDMKRLGMERAPLLSQGLGSSPCQGLLLLLLSLELLLLSLGRVQGCLIPLNGNGNSLFPPLVLFPPLPVFSPGHLLWQR